MTNEIANVNSNVPAYISGTQVNNDDINLSEIKIPVIKTGQPTSEDVVSGKVKYGEIYSTIGDSFGEALDVVIIKPFINYVVFEDGKLAGRSNNSTVWEEGILAGQPIDQAISYRYKRYNFYVLPVGAKDAVPYCLSMYSTSGAKEGQKLYNLMTLSMVKEKIPCFAKIYTISSFKDKNDKGQFAAWKVSATNTYASESLFSIASEARKFIDINSHIITVHEDPVVASKVAEPTVEPIGEF